MYDTNQLPTGSLTQGSLGASDLHGDRGSLIWGDDGAASPRFFEAADTQPHPILVGVPYTHILYGLVS